MLTADNHIVKDAVLRQSQDFDALRQEGIGWLEKLGSSLWTDYNLHDPGITVLEALCYAITDLGYRASYSMRDLLTTLDPNGVAINTGTFHTARPILSTYPITFDDLRKVLIDVPGVRMAWIRKNNRACYRVDSVLGVLETPDPSPSITDCFVLKGLYDVFLEYDETVSDASVLTRDVVRTNVESLLFQYRNLGEDFVRICEMKPEEIALCADLELEPFAVIEEVQAELFYRIGTHIAPPVRFYTLAEMRSKGKSIDEIFEGPALTHGFIDHEEFLSITRLCSIRVSDLIQICMGIEGVKAVKSIELVSYLDGVPTVYTPTQTQNGWVLPLSNDAFRAPVFSPDKSKVFFYKNNLPYLANKLKSKGLLSEKKAQDLHAKLNLKPKDLDLPVPIGDYKDLSAYASIQNDMPATYLVGRLRVPESATDLRKAEARQLKAYLLVFDQILANALAQLANLQTLFSWETTTSGQSYFTAPLPAEAISNLSDLYENFASLGPDLTAIIETPALAAERRNQFADHLLARFAESLSEYTQLMQTLFDTDQGPRVVRDKQRLLQKYPEASVQRGKGSDCRFPDLPAEWIAPLSSAQENTRTNLTGYQKRTYRLLGFEKVERRQLAGHRLTIQSVTIGGEIQWRFVLESKTSTPAVPDLLFASITCPNREDIEALLDEAFELGSDPAQYALNGAGTAYELGQSCGGTTNKIGETTSTNVLDEVIEYFQTYADSEGFHVIEHLLLRKRTQSDALMPIELHAPGGECDCPEVTDPYSFRISVYLPSWSRRFRKIRFRQFVEKTLREECPAHLFPKICWISHEQMRELENRLNDWQQLLKKLPLGGCCLDETDALNSQCQETQRWGISPLPATQMTDQAYRDALGALIDCIHETDTVFPTARLHGCNETDGDNPEITLDNTSLGTL